MNFEPIGDIVIALGIVFGIVVFIRENANYLLKEEKNR